MRVVGYLLPQVVCVPPPILLVFQIGTMIQQQVNAAVSKAMTTPALAQGMWCYIYTKLYGAFKPGHQESTGNWHV